METTRKSLLLRVKDRGDSTAWREFDGIYRPMLVRFGRARGLSIEEAEEVAQHCLGAIVKHIQSFEYDPAKGGFKKYLGTMVNNRVRSLLRKRGEQQAATGVFQRAQKREESPEQVWDRIWMAEHLDQCLTSLRETVKPTNFEAFRLSQLEQRPIDDVCKQLGITAAQVYVARSRMTSKLREMMRARLDEDDAPRGSTGAGP